MYALIFYLAVNKLIVDTSKNIFSQRAENYLFIKYTLNKLD